MYCGYGQKRRRPYLWASNRRRPKVTFDKNQTLRLTSICLISPIALAGLSPFGQVFAQFMIVWQR